MLCLITASTSAATGVALEVIGVPTSTVLLPEQGLLCCRLAAKPLAANQTPFQCWAVVWTAACTLPIVLRLWAHGSTLFPVP